jgi:peptidoglycan/xylan/chitin deacetylase (PgdA/CDA1 family)
MPETAFICLMYHVLDDPSAGRYSLAGQAFLGQLDWLKAEGFVVEGFAGLEARLSGNGWPARYAVATFDDGHRSFLRAAEEFAARGFQATFFLTRELCRNRPDFLKDPEIRRLAERGEVGAHGVTHRPISQLPRAEARRELMESKQWLEDVTGREIRHMSAPGGFWNRASQGLAREAGYTLVGNSVPWWNRPEQVAGERQVNRVALLAQFGPGVFQRILARAPGFFAAWRLRSWLLALPKAIRGRWEIQRRRPRAE